MAADKPIIEWNELDWRPAWISSGPMKGLGYADRLQKQLIEQMPDYEHRSFIGNWARLTETTARPNVCFTAAFYEWPDENGKPRTDVVWSAPTILFFYHGIITRRDMVDRIKQLGDGHAVSLKAILANQGLRFGAQPGRPFSRWIDPILSEVKPTANVIERHGDRNLSEGMFDMLSAGRIDYFVDYYPMLQYRELSRQAQGRFTYIPIAEHEGYFGLGAFACAKAGGGQAKIDRINQILEKLRETPEFRSASSDWFMRPDNRMEFNLLWETELMFRSK